MGSGSTERAANIAIIVAVVAIAATRIAQYVDSRTAASVSSSTTVGQAPPPVLLAGWEAMVEDALPLGPVHAPVRMIVFTDLECRSCAVFHQEVMPTLAKRYGEHIGVFVVHRPLRSHRFAMQAASALECASEDGRHGAFLDAVYARQDSIGLRPWLAYAKDAALVDTARFAACLDMAPPPRISAGAQWAGRFGIHSTPTVIVNGWLFHGVPSAEDVQAVADSVLQGIAGATPPPPVVPFQEASLIEELRLDGRALDFSVLGPAKIGPRGEMALTFSQDQQVRIFDADGQHLASVGRRGRGPGEFEGVQVRGWTGDTVWVYDHALHRHTFVSRRGTVLRTVAIAPALQPARPSGEGALASIFTPHAIRSDGSMLGLAHVAGSDEAGRAATKLAIVHATSDGSVQVRVFVPEPDARWLDGLAFRPQAAFAPDGSRIAWIRVDDMIATGGTFTIAVFSSNGDTVFVRSYPYLGERLPARAADSIARLRLGDPDRHGRASAASAVARDRVPPVYSPVDGFGIGTGGTIWIATRARSGGVVVLLLDTGGDPVRSVRIPARSRVAAASPTHLWVREADADGLASLVRYRIDR